MANLDSFISKYRGKSVPNNNGGFKGECVSLAARYAQEVQGVPGGDSVLYVPVSGGARDLYEQYDNPRTNYRKYYDKIPYGKPRKRGDLVVWGSNLGKYGDVAIALDSGNTVFGQLGTPVFIPAAVRTESRKPLGYLRRKGESVSIDKLNKVESVHLFSKVFHKKPTAKETNGIVGRGLMEVLDSFENSSQWKAQDKKLKTPTSTDAKFKTLAAKVKALIPFTK